MPRPRGLIVSKTRVPPVGGGTIDRPRVLGALRAAADGRGVLLVVAPAGSGKTTAVAQLVRARPGPHAWLSLWDSDDGPGRFTTYLAAAVAAFDTAGADRIRHYLEDGLAPGDCAALIGEGLPAGATVVLDDLHHIEARAPVLRALRAFLDAATPGALIVLVSRRPLDVHLGRDVLAGRVGVLPEDELAFRPDEIAALLEARGLGGRADDVAARSGGWAAGLVFEALREEPRDAAAPPAEDPFFAYLGSEVLDALPGRLRGAVLASALLDVVDARRLAALLGIESAESLFAEICRQHLPGVLGEDGFRYHPRFREFLLAVLRRERPGDLGELRARYGRALLADGHAEEAADALIAAGAREEAEDVVAAAASALMRRGDWDKVIGWCEALGEDTLARRADLRGVQVRALLMSRRQDDVEDLVRRLHADGELERLGREAPDVAAWAAWSLHVAGDWAGMLELAPPAGATRRARVIRFIAGTALGEDPPDGWEEGELDRPWPLHIALQSALWYRGDFAGVERLAWAAGGRGPVTATLAEIYRIAVMRARGDLADARAALERVAPRIRASRFIEFWQQVEAELAFAEGDREGGLERIREARETSRRHGYRLADRAVFAAIEGRMLVRLGAVPEALEVLAAARAWSAARGLLCFREWADLGLAEARLALGGDPDPALELLAGAVAGMERAGRRLELPAARIAQAEALWRAGDEAGHDAAADAAHAAAVAMGTLGPLLAALDAFPDVLARRIDAAPEGDPVWRPLARAGAVAAGGRTTLEGAALVVRTLGGASVEAGGAPVAALSAKAVELAAAVAAAGAAGVARAALAAELFEGSADGGNHLRQLVHRLRRALPPGVTLESPEGRLAWSPPGAAVAEDRVMEALVARAGREVGRAREETIAEALRMAGRGPYLPGAEGEAAARRRAGLAAVVAGARRDHARALLEAGRPAPAAAEARAAVEAEPYREDGWQLLMRAEAAAGGPASALPPFLACAEALAEVGLEPSDATRDLLARLRDGRVTGP
ncbi:MAG: BTAD domain-containing putative transcriptional regulator [Thermoleophilia bacterium]